jgi:signal peptidase II
VTRGAAWTRALLVVAGVLVVDQVSKALVRADITSGDSVRVTSFFHLVNTRNTGIAFGGLGGTWLVGVLVVIALIGIVAVFNSYATRRLAWLPAGLLLGGALGNIIDRVHDSGVTDFLKFPHWPQFNIADVAITIGVLSLFFVIDDSEKSRKTAGKSAETDSGEELA